MNREEFKQRMKSLKSYRENNPGKGYWDWKVEQFQTGGEKRSNIVNGVRVNPYTGQPIATGAITPVIDLEDAANFTPVGDALAVRDAYNAVRNRDWLGLGLAGLAAVPFVPTVNRRGVQDAIDRMFAQNERRAARNAELNNEVNRVAERILDDPDYLDRAVKFDPNYVETYADILDAYNNSYDNVLPRARRTDLNGARGQMVTTTEATRRHQSGGDFPGIGEYMYLYDDTSGSPRGMTIHEMNHFVDFLTNKAPDATGTNTTLRKMSKDLKNDDPYFSNPTEQKAYMNQLREYMFEEGLINRRGQQVDKNTLQRAIKGLPEDLNAIRKASKQFKNMDGYTEWFNAIPLVDAGTRVSRNTNNELV